MTAAHCTLLALLLLLASSASESLAAFSWSVCSEATAAPLATKVRLVHWSTRHSARRTDRCRTLAAEGTRAPVTAYTDSQAVTLTPETLKRKEPFNITIAAVLREDLAPVEGECGSQT